MKSDLIFKTKETFSRNKILIGSIFALFFIPNFSQAGGLMITPSRVELSEKTNTQEVKLINNGNETTTYRILFQNLRMKENGDYEEIKDTNDVKEKFADKFVKFSPKRVTLKPGETQTIRILASKPNEEAEFRSHLLFKEEVSEDFGNSIEQKGDKKNISIVLKPVFSISIPVILSNGKVESKVTMESLELKNEENGKSKFISVKLNRTGNGSAYGRLVVNFSPKDSKSKVELGNLSNISVYYPYDSRIVAIPLIVPKGVKLSNGDLEVKFYSKASDSESDSEKKENILAQKSISLN